MLSTEPRKISVRDANASAISEATGGIEVFNSSGSRSCFLGATESGGVLSFGTNNSERLRINSAGEVLIGTTSADSETQLTVCATGTSKFAKLDLWGTNSNGDNSCRSRILSRQGSGLTDSVLTFSTRSSGSLDERMRIDSDGRLILGTTTEGHVSADNFTVADSGHCGISIRSGTTSEGAIYFSDGTSGDAEYRGQVLYDHDGDYMRFSTAVSERLRIDSSGRLGVNNTAPDGAGIDVKANRTTNYSATTDQRSLAHIIARNETQAANRIAANTLVNGGGPQAEGSINHIQHGNYIGILHSK